MASSHLPIKLAPAGCGTGSFKIRIGFNS
jgi:hypothetical protein